MINILRFYSGLKFLLTICQYFINSDNFLIHQKPSVKSAKQLSCKNLFCYSFPETVCSLIVFRNIKSIFAK